MTQLEGTTEHDTLCDHMGSASADLAVRAVDSQAAVVAPGHKCLQTLPGTCCRAYPIRLPCKRGHSKQDKEDEKGPR